MGSGGRGKNGNRENDGNREKERDGEKEGYFNFLWLPQKFAAKVQLFCPLTCIFCTLFSSLFSSPSFFAKPSFKIRCFSSSIL